MTTDQFFMGRTVGGDVGNLIVNQGDGKATYDRCAYLKSPEGFGLILSAPQTDELIATLTAIRAAAGPRPMHASLQHMLGTESGRWAYDPAAEAISDRLYRLDEIEAREGND